MNCICMLTIILNAVCVQVYGVHSFKRRTFSAECSIQDFNRLDLKEMRSKHKTRGCNDRYFKRRVDYIELSPGNF